MSECCLLSNLMTPSNFDSIFRSKETGILQRVSDRFKISSRPEYAHCIRHASPIMEEEDEITAEVKDCAATTYDDDETDRGDDFFSRGGCDNRADVEERGEQKALLLFSSFVILFALVPWMFYVVRVVVAHV